MTALLSPIFAVQDRTGTVAQFTMPESPSDPVAINDTGNYTGVQPWNGETVTFLFTVIAVNDASDIVVSTALPDGQGPGNILQSGWPPSGTIKWVTGANAGLSSPGDDAEVTGIYPANAYISVAEFEQYQASRGNPYPASPVSAIETAIVQATDYLDQKYRFKGVKLLQFLSNPDLDPMIAFIDPWLSPFGFTETAYFVPSTTDQHTEWPRQGCVDFNGDTVFDVPLVVKWATAEAALRVLNGTPLQPDYSSNVVADGGIIQTLTQEVGPIRTTTTYDTKLGIGFFPSIPHIDRMFARAGILVAGGGRSILR